MKTIYCNECDKKIDIKLKEKKHGNGVTETYFTCRNCKVRYTAFVLNVDARRMQREIKGLHHTSVTSKVAKEREAALINMNDMQRDLKFLMGELKAGL